MLYRMVMDDHICPYGLKSKWLLEHEGLHVDDRHLKSRSATEAFKQQHDVETTPQTFIGGQRVGGYDELREYFDDSSPASDEKSYQPVIALFAISCLLALATSWAAFGDLVTIRTAEWFIAFSMAMLAMLKLQDVESFSTMFLNYDLLAQRWVPYSFVYPFAEASAAVLMTAGVLTIVSAPVALFVGGVGAVSVVKAVWIDKRAVRCACVGGNSNVPLGMISLTENLAMVAMGIWMPLKAWLGVG